MFECVLIFEKGKLCLVHLNLIKWTKQSFPFSKISQPIDTQLFLWMQEKNCFLDYDGPEGPLFSSKVSCEVFGESDIVLRSVNQF